MSKEIPLSIKRYYAGIIAHYKYKYAKLIKCKCGVKYKSTNKLGHKSSPEHINYLLDGK